MNKSVISWALYDVANTVFNLGVVGIFLPLLLINERQGTADADLGFTVGASMVIVLVAGPFLGALTDQLNVRVRIFTFLNITAAISICMIGFSPVLLGSLVFFSMAFVCVYLAELLYNSMLSEVSTPRNRGKVGGAAIGLGYVGSLVVIGVIWVAQYLVEASNQNLGFIGIACIFIVTALPITMFFVEGRNYATHPRKNALLSSIWVQITQTWNYFRGNSKLRMFFIARYFYIMAVTTASGFAFLYGVNTIGLSETQILIVIIVGTVVAIPSAVLWGFIVDFSGPAPALKWNIVGWVLILACSVSIPWMNLPNLFWWPLGVMTGFCFGGLWVADRPLLIQLSPPEKLGEMFGIYGATSRLAYLTGAFAWPLVAVKLGLGQPAAVFLLLCCSLVGLGILLRWFSSRDSWPVENRYF